MACPARAREIATPATEQDQADARHKRRDLDVLVAGDEVLGELVVDRPQDRALAAGWYVALRSVSATCWRRRLVERGLDPEAVEIERRAGGRPDPDREDPDALVCGDLGAASSGSGRSLFSPSLKRTIAASA